MKKFLSLLLAAMMVASLLTGCGDDTAADTNTDADAGNTETAQTNWNVSSTTGSGTELKFRTGGDQGTYYGFGSVLAQAITTNGHTIALPAPLSDVNAAISLGCLSYGVILVGGIVANGLKGAGKALKDFSLPISMSFRMFGALLSGLLVTELVYYYVTLSYVIPVIVAVLFTLLHALIQAYVLTTLTSMFYGETTEKHAPKPRKTKKVKAETVNN